MKSKFVVEVSPVILGLIKFLFTNFGYENRKAWKGIATLKIEKKNRFVLKFLKKWFQGFEGSEVLNEIKKILEIQRTSVIFPEAHSMKGNADRFLKEGCSGHIPTFFNLSRFKSLLNACTGGYRVL